MDPNYSGWWHRHGWTIAVLLAAFASAFAIRTIWTYPVVAQYGPLYTYAGGSDSYYHSRVMSYIILNHTNLVRDPLLRFPVGAVNPREPLFDWMNALLGMVFAPAFGGNAVVAGAWFLDLQAPLWAALSVFPIYLIGKEVSGRRMGLIAAMIYPFLSASIDSSIFGYANYLSFYTFIMLITIYSYIRTVKAVGNRRWIESYRKPGQFLPGLKAFLRTERNAVKWAVFTGVSLGAFALSWQGYTYAVVVIWLSVLILMVAERIRRVDSFGLYTATWIVGLVGFPMEFPYYFVQYRTDFAGFESFFLLQALLFFGILVLLLPFLMLRDVPWVFSIPLMVGLIAAGAAGLFVVNPGLFTTIVTGQGYFVKTLIYSTVAEAQAPSVDQLVIGYGIVTFFLAFVGVALFLYFLVRGRFKRVHVVFLVFAILSIYLPVSATKFFLLGAPAFALLPAEAISRALDVGSYPELRRTVASLSDRRSQFAAFRKAFKARHVLVLLLVLVILLPNVWVAIDAGIPGNTKSGYAAQVGATLPPWLQLNTSSPSNYYFGAAGTSLDTPNQYDSAGYNWLAEQDTNIPQPRRPAFVSWWDYGFQAIDQGQHPSVADNFQNGIDPAGQFLLAQNESIAIGVLATTLLNGAQSGGTGYLPGGLDQIVAQNGLNVSKLNSDLVNQSADFTTVVNDPGLYLPVDSSTLTDLNAMFMVTSYYIAGSLTQNGVAGFYNAIQAYTGHSIRYAMTDSRLIPFGGNPPDTGIYYAPAELTGRLIDGSGNPSTYFNVTVLGSDGNTYPEDAVPADVSPVEYYTNYFSPFYNSMIYHIYFGYNGTEAGLGPGIPGLTLNASIEPGWMLQHFQVVYQTAYYCPNPNSTSNCLAENKPTAIALANATNGTADTSASSYFGGGESFLEYYPGQTLLGEVRLPNGAAVSGATVTVDDGWGIPHMVTTTAKDGSFSLVLPPGNDTVNITIGSADLLTQQRSTVLESVKIVVPNAIGLSYDAPTVARTFTLQPASVAGTVYWQTTNSTSYTPGEPLLSGAKVVLWGDNLSTVTATTDLSGSFSLPNVPAGVYNYSILYAGHNYSEGNVSAVPGTPTNLTTGLPAASIGGHVFQNGAPVGGALVSVTGAGFSRTNVSTAAGNYSVTALGPGNYTVIATFPGTSLRSVGAFVAISTPGASSKLNLTLTTTAPVTVSVTANGLPASGIPVRFVPLPTFANSSTPPITSLEATTTNGTVVTSSVNGRATAVLPVGSYEVYALGFVGSTLEAGLGTVTASVTTPRAPLSVALSPAVSLRGTVTQAGPSGSASSTAVIVYGAAGGEAVGWAASNGSYAFYLPAGAYSVLAIQGPSAGTGTVYAALASVSLPTAPALTLTPSVAVAVRFTLGALNATGALFAAPTSLVNVSFGSNGATVPVVGSSSGVIATYLPSSLPLSAGSYCVRASAPGFASATQCGLSPNALGTLSTLPLALTPVTVTLRLPGLPTTGTATVNLTAASPSAASRTVSSGPTGTVSLLPGTYQVSGWTPWANGTILYRPAAPLTATIPLGAATASVSLRLVPEINTTGTLTLPAGASLGTTYVSLSSPPLNVSVNGTAYTTGFYAAVGTYSVYANVTVAGQAFTNVTRVSVPSAGAITPTITLRTGGIGVNGSLVQPSGSPLLANTTVTLTTPGGATVLASVVNGSFYAVLPTGVTYGVAGSTVTPIVGPNGTYAASWTAASGSSCTITTTSAQCSVEFVPTTMRVWLNGTLTASGMSGPVPGTVRLVGPYPYTNLTIVSAPNGTFSAWVLPGAYSIYASASSLSDLLANFGSSLVLPGANPSVAVALQPTWLDTIAPASANGSLAAPGPANVTVASVFGTSTVYPGVTASSPVQIALPVGTYFVSALATGSPYGVATAANASATVAIVSGNVGTVLRLAYEFTPSVTATTIGPSSVTVVGGTHVVFQFRFQNHGNVPVTVHPVGSPAYWNFTFSFGNLTLPVGGSPVTGIATIYVPTGTIVEHPSIAIAFALPNGTIIGSVLPAPIIHVVGVYGVAAGIPPTSSPAQVGPTEARVPFYTVNTGNQGETVQVSAVDANRLTSLGWSTTFQLAGQNISNGVSYLAAGQNVTWFVLLNATGPIFVPPGAVHVAVTVLNASGSAQASVALPVPFGSVSPSTAHGIPIFTVTGPGVGSAPSSLPDWVVPVLVFVPALALIGVILLYRWNRSRRWRRR